VTPICFLPNQLELACVQFFRRHHFVLYMELAQESTDYALYANYVRDCKQNYAAIIARYSPQSPPVVLSAEPPDYLTSSDGSDHDDHHNRFEGLAPFRSESPKPKAKSDTEAEVEQFECDSRPPIMRFAGVDCDSDDSDDEVEVAVDTVLHTNVSHVRRRFDIQDSEMLHRWIACSLMTHLIPHRGLFNQPTNQRANAEREREREREVK
jgi:hypothetical protein